MEKLEQMAREFSASIKQQLTAAELAEIVNLNAVETKPYVCHSQDFCDSDQLLRDVFNRHGMDMTNETNIERFSPVWDEVWFVAKENNFWIC